MPPETSAQEQPLVSIICRSIGRAQLAQALQSVSAQTYPHIEIVLVDALGKGLGDVSAYCGKSRLVLVADGQRRGRSAAGNAGLDIASGEYLMFLDDDDWIAKDHVSSLVSALTGQTKFRAAYSSTQKTDLHGNPVDYIFDQEFDALLLMRDNFIPIHSMLFEKSLLAAGCRLDEKFDIYEDWDFWLQLSRHTAFLHIAHVSAFYRGGGDSGTAVADTGQRYKDNNSIGKGRIKIYDKWLNIWKGQEFNQLLGQMDKSVALYKLETDNANLTHQLAGKQLIVLDLEKRNAYFSEENSALKANMAYLEAHIVNLDASIDHLNSDLEALKSETQKYAEIIRAKSIEIENALHTIHSHKAHIANLEQSLNLIYRSPGWRIMGPFRRLARLLFKPEPPANFLRKKPLALELQVPPTVPISKETRQALEPEDVAESEQPLVAPQQPEDPKKKYSEAAVTGFAKFLASNKRLAFPKEPNPSVSIILVFFNQAHLSLLCLESILKHADVSYQLVIVDNNSTDQTPQLLERLQNAIVIRNDSNLGFVKAVNIGASAATGQQLLLLNNDALLEKGTLSYALETLLKEPEAGAVGAKIKLLDGSLQEAGSIIWSDGSCLGYGRGKQPESPEFMYQRDVDYCSGAFLLFRKSDFDNLGGFDESFSPAYYEESDFCVRLRQSGRRIVYQPKAQITHYEFASSGGLKGASRLQIEHRDLFHNKHREFLDKSLPGAEANILRARTSNDYPNVLVIDDRVPHRNLGSGYPRSADILSCLAKMKLNVSFYPLQFPDDDWNHVYSSIPVTIEVLLNHGRSGLAAFLSERSQHYQYVLISRIHNMEFFNHTLSSHPDISLKSRIIYDAEALTAPRELMRRSLYNNHVTAAEKSAMYLNEFSQANSARTVIAVSENEADIYRENGIDDVIVLGHSLQISPTPNEFDQRSDILFVGALRDDGSPNVDSLLWFVSSILPIIEKAFPDIVLHVVGENTASSLVPINKHNVRFHGRLNSIESLYNSCKVFIAPTRFAAGIPHKVHESASKGLPAVVTNLLARQLGWEHGNQVLAGDTAEEFAAQVVRAYSDRSLWNTLRKNSLQSVSSDCSIESFASRLAKLFI